MTIDASIYNNIRPVQFEMPSPVDAAQKAMTLSSLGMQQAQAQRQMMVQAGARQAYAKNTDATGKLNQQGFLSDIANVDPSLVLDYKNKFNEAGKQEAEARTAQVSAAEKALNFTIPALHYLNKMTPEQRAASWDGVLDHLESSGVPVQHMRGPYDEGRFQNIYKMVDSVGSESKAFLDNQKTKAETGKINTETEKTVSETYKRNPDIMGQTDDPSKLVANMVPKEHQAKALEEIKNAEDIKALAPKIMAAFEKGSSRNPNIAAQGQREFEGLINTTVKETEGTTRQAAFDSIHKTMTPSGLLAGLGENAAKARTVEEYLTSKMSAPITRAYGVDLTKFKSTAPYKNPKNNPTKGASGSWGEKSAYAAERPNFDAMSDEDLQNYVKGVE